MEEGLLVCLRVCVQDQCRGDNAEFTESVHYPTHTLVRHSCGVGEIKTKGNLTKTKKTKQINKFPPPLSMPTLGWLVFTLRV